MGDPESSWTPGQGLNTGQTRICSAVSAGLKDIMSSGGKTPAALRAEHASTPAAGECRPRDGPGGSSFLIMSLVCAPQLPSPPSRSFIGSRRGREPGSEATSFPPSFPQRRGRRVAVRRSRRAAAGRRRARRRRPRSVGRCPAGGAVAARAALGSSGSCAARSPRAPAILAPAPQPLRLVPPSPPGAAQRSPAGDGTRAAPPPGGERGSEAGRSREGAGPAALLRQPPWRGGPAAPEAGAHARSEPG